MYFYYEQLIPFTTIENNPVVTRLKLSAGLLDFVDVGFPKGVNRFAKCRIFWHEFQLIPFNRDGWFTGNDITLRLPLNLVLDTEPYELTILSINLDDTYDHTLSFAPSISTPQPLTQSVLNQLVTVSNG